MGDLQTRTRCLSVSCTASNPRHTLLLGIATQSSLAGASTNLSFTSCFMRSMMAAIKVCCEQNPPVGDSHARKLTVQHH